MATRVNAESTTVLSATDTEPIVGADGERKPAAVSVSPATKTRRSRGQNAQKPQRENGERFLSSPKCFHVLLTRKSQIKSGCPAATSGGSLTGPPRMRISSAFYSRHALPIRVNW
jgi:hypothetical protein